MKPKKIAISAEQAQELYGVNKGTLANLRNQKKGPPYYKVPGKGNRNKVIYRVDEFEAWLFSNPIKTSTD